MLNRQGVVHHTTGFNILSSETKFEKDVCPNYVSG